MGILPKWAETAIDYAPGLSNMKGLATGDMTQAVGGPVTRGARDIESATGVNMGPLADGLGNSLGDIIPDGVERLFEAPDTQALDPALSGMKDFGDGILNEYGSRTPVQAPTIEAPQLQRTELAPAAQTTVTTAEGATVDAAPSNAVRAQQMELAKTLEARARGEGPSVAVETAKALTEEAQAAQRAMAISAGRGGNMAGAQRAAAMNTAKLAGQQARTAAMARAAEIAGATGQLGSVLDATRGTDVDIAKTDASLKQDVNKFNANAANTVGVANTNAANETNIAQGNITSTENRTDAGNKLTAAANNQDAALTASGQTITRDAGLRDDIGDNLNNQVSGQSTKIGLDESGKNRGAAVLGAGINAAAGAGATLLPKLSDKRAKTDVKDLPDNDLLDMVIALDPATFKYKGGSETEPGVMAQDLEKTPVGAALVDEGPDGLKRIDLEKTIPVVLATLGALARRRSEKR